MYLIAQSVDVSLAEIGPWNVIMGPTGYGTTILLPKPSKNLRCVSQLEPGISDCRLHRVSSKRKFLVIYGTAWRTTHLATSGPRLLLSYVQDLWSLHHRLRIWAILSVTTTGLAIEALLWILDLWSSRHVGHFCGNRIFNMNIQFFCHLCQ
jgi:hypothetical protein